MLKLDEVTKTISLEDYGITSNQIHYQLSANQLHNKVISLNQGIESSTGALIINTGEFTGRSPKDRFIVKDNVTKDLIWWGEINLPFSLEKFDLLYDKVIAYLNQKPIYVRDSFACSDHNYRLNIRIINEHPWSNYFAYNMFIRPKDSELLKFKPDWSIINAPGFMANSECDFTRQHNFAIINFTKKIILIGGTGYTGEIKKSIFSVLNFILPQYKNTLPMHCSANVGQDGSTAIFLVCQVPEKLHYLQTQNEN